MRLASKRALDYYAGRPALALLQLAALLLAAVLRRNHSTDPVHTVLIVKFQGLGSLVMAKPALAELRRRRPDTRIVYWGAHAMQPLAEQMPEFDEVLVLDDRTVLSAARSVLTALSRLWRYRIDWAVDLEVYSRLSSVLVTLSCARNRTGFAVDQIRSRRVHTHLVYFNRQRHLGEAYARLIGQLLPADCLVNGADYGSWRFDLAALPTVPSPYLVFNIHAGDLALERRWPRESFQRLIDELLRRQPDATAVLIGHGKAERAYGTGMPTRDRLIDLTGRLTLADTFRVLANAALVVSNDTAPMHFALSTQSKVVGVFGPTHPAAYFPSGNTNAAAAYVSLYCSPCVHYWEPLPCNGDNQCMKRLAVSQVLALCCGLLGIPAEPPLRAEPVEGGGQPSSYYPGLVYRRRGP